MSRALPGGSALRGRPPRARAGPDRPGTRRVALLVAAPLLVGLVALVAVLLAARRPTVAPAPAAPSAAEAGASAALLRAAGAVGFHPMTEPGVGEIEDKPAAAALPPTNGLLLPVGARAPGFSLLTPQGQRVSLAAERGKALLLEFFTTWCPHCNAEAPHLRALARSLPPARYAFLAVNADGETAPSVYAFERYYGLPYPALLDPSSDPGTFSNGGTAGAVTSAYDVLAYPTFYVIDPAGRIVWRSDGEQPDALLREELARAAGR